MKLNELLEKCAKLSQDELVVEGKAAYSVFGEKLAKAGYPQKEIVAFATMLVRLAAGADRYGAEEELDLFMKVTGIDTDAYEFKAMTKNADEEGFVAAIDEIVDSLDKEAKEATLRFVAVFFVADDHISEKERALLKRLED